MKKIEFQIFPKYLKLLSFTHFCLMFLKFSKNFFSRASTPIDSADESQDADNRANDGADKTEHEADNGDNGTISRFTGPFASLKMTMSELLMDWQQSGITKIADLPLFETRMDDAQTLDEMVSVISDKI